VANHLENTWQTWTIAATNPPADQLKSTLEGWFINLLPDLNQNDPETATYLIQNSLWWVGMAGLDAIRQDTLPYVPRAYWARWTAALKRQFPHLTILGEMWDGNPRLVAFFQGGSKPFDGVDSGIDTLFDFPLHYAIRDVFAKGQPMTRLAQTLAADALYVNPRVLVTFLGLHDTARFLNEPGATLAGLKLAFTFLLTTRGTPLIYYGDEIAMRGGGDPDNRRDFPGGWSEDPGQAFEPSGRTAEQAEVHAHVKRLLALRRRCEPLRRGSLVGLVATENTYAAARVSPKQLAVAAINRSTQPQTLELDLAAARLGSPKTLTDRLGGLGRLPVIQGVVKLTLPPRSAAVLTHESSQP
jgi:glycosidase